MNATHLLTEGVCFPKGFSAAGIHCGLRKNTAKKDLALLVSDVPASAAAVYTKNQVQGAPLLVTKQHLADGTARAVICNSGNANTCNADGVMIAKQMCEKAALALGLSAEELIVASTGVIGVPLSIDPIASAMPSLVHALDQTPQAGHAAAQAILTTDTHPKEAALSRSIGGTCCRIGGMAKGSGMIHPNMATMLSFLTTDVSISPPLLQQALSEVVADTFNMISVDGDTSTNDMVVLLANGMAEQPRITAAGTDFDLFVEGLRSICLSLARMIAKDGEGATKFIACTVLGAESLTDARVLAKAVIASNLVKAALFGADANWGRILCALGYAGVPFQPERVSVSFQSAAGIVAVCEHGQGVVFQEDHAKQVLSRPEVEILVDLHQGRQSATAFGCDLTYDYVKINGDYRT